MREINTERKVFCYHVDTVYIQRKKELLQKEGMQMSQSSLLQILLASESHPLLWNLPPLFSDGTPSDQECKKFFILFWCFSLVFYGLLAAEKN